MSEVIRIVEKKNSLVTNSFFFVGYKLFNALLPLITSAVIARALLPEGVGLIAVAQNHVTYFTYIAALGLPVYGTREIARVRGNEKRDKVFSELFTINFISSIACIIVYYIMTIIIVQVDLERKLHLIFGILIIFNIINVDWVYQGFEEYKYISIRSFVLKLLSFLATLVLVKNKDDILTYAVILCIGTVGNYIFNIINLVRRKIVHLQFSELNLSRHMKPLMILFASSISIELYTLVDTTMLGVMCPTNVIGYYTNAMKLVRATVVFFTAISTVVAPQISNRFGMNDFRGISNLVSKVLGALIAITIPATLGMTLTSDYIMQCLFGASFAPASITLSILAMLLIPVTISTFFGSHVLCSIDHEKDMLYATIAGAVSNIFLNVVLIHFYKQNGAALASVISEWIVVIVDFLFVIRIVKVQIDKKILSSVVMGSGVMTIFILIMRMFDFSVFIKLVIIVMGACIVYGMCMIIMKNSLTNMMLKKICSHRRR